MKASKSYSKCTRFLRNNGQDFTTIRKGGEWLIVMKRSAFELLYRWLCDNEFLNWSVHNPGYENGMRHRRYRISSTPDI